MRARTARLLVAGRGDLRLQWRYRIAPAAGVATAVWIALLRGAPGGAVPTALPLAIFSDLGLVALFFLPGLVMYERDERVLPALVVSPLRFAEYLAAKLTVLTGLALAASALLVLSVPGQVRLGPLLAGVVLLSLVVGLTGFVIVARCRSVVEYLMAVQLPALPLSLPVVWALGLDPGPLLALVPTHAAMLLLTAAYRPVPAGALATALTAAMAWLVVLWLLAHRAYRRHILGGGG